MINDSFHIAVVIPCFNEEGNIGMLFSRLHECLRDYSYECIFVDDGSTDGSLEEIKKLSNSTDQIKYISFSRNFGHQKALLAGIRYTQADAVIMMDADMQQPVSVLPILIDRWRNGYEVVNTIRTRSAGKGFMKRLTSRLFYSFFDWVTHLDLKNGSAEFRLIDRHVVSILQQSKEENLFLRGMICWCGFRQTWVEYEEDLRFSGKTKYSLSKMLRLSVDGITSFSIRPLRLAMILSALCAIFALIEIIYVLYIAFFTNDAVSGWSSLAILISILGAINLLLMGFIGEYIGRIFIQGKGRPAYIIKETNCYKQNDE